MEFFKIDRALAHDATESGNFSGQVWMQRLITKQQSNDIELLVVSFEAGGRTRPHIHAVDQILQITSGRGIVATGTERRFIVPGELFVVPRGVEHQPFAKEEVHLLLIEPTGTPNTGDAATASPRQAI